MKITKLMRAALTVTAALVVGGAHAQTAYPSRPIKLIVPFAPGGSTDIAARLVAEYTTREIGQSIVVENKPGAGGSTGMEFVARAPTATPWAWPR